MSQFTLFARGAMEDDENSTLQRNATGAPQLFIDTKPHTKTSTSRQLKPSPKPPERRTSLNWRRRYSTPVPISPIALVQKPRTPKRRTSLRWRNSFNLQSLLQQQETKLSAESSVANDSAPTESQNIAPPNNDRPEPSLQISVSANHSDPVISGPKSLSNDKTTTSVDINASESALDDWELANFDDLNLASGSDSDTDSEKLEAEEKRIRTKLEAFANECFPIGTGIMPSVAQKPKQIIFDNIKNADLRKLV